MRKKSKRKKPLHKEKPKARKVPRGLKKADYILDKRISWHIGILDKDGPWSWNNIDEHIFWDYIHKKLSEYEKLTWQEIFKYRLNHSIKKSELSDEAKKRLSEIKQDDVDELVSLGITKVSRVLGIQDRNILKVLWWDPNHQVCPSKKKHT